MNALRGLMGKGLTGWEAGRLQLQNLVDQSFGKAHRFSNTEREAIRNTPLDDRGIRTYNKLIALCGDFYRAVTLAELSSNHACLKLTQLSELLRAIDHLRKLDLMRSMATRLVTEEQYLDIVDAQRAIKMAAEFDLAYVVEERFLALLDPEGKEEMDELYIDSSSAKEFVDSIPKRYKPVYRQAIGQVRELYASGRLEAFYSKRDGSEISPSLKVWSRGKLSMKKTLDLMDLTYTTGDRLYDCESLPEWKSQIDHYQRNWLADKDDRFSHMYAIVQDCPDTWIDSSGHYRDPLPGYDLLMKLIKNDIGLPEGCSDRQLATEGVSKVQARPR